MALASFFFRLVLVGLEIRGQRALGKGLGSGFSSFVFAENEGELLDGAGLEITERGPGDAAKNGGIEFIALPCSD